MTEIADTVLEKDKKKIRPQSKVPQEEEPPCELQVPSQQKQDAPGVPSSLFGGIASYGVDKDEPPCPFEQRKSYDEF